MCNENEMLQELTKLRIQVSTEFDGMREYLWDKERSIDGLIRGVMQKVSSSIDTRLDEAYKSAVKSGMCHEISLKGE